MLNIEHKEDSTAKLEAVQGKPSKNFLFAEEVNQIVEEVNSIGSALNPDRIISLGTETIDGNECTYEGYTWQLGGVSVNNTGNPSVIVLPSATTGYKRNDISVFKADGTIERVAGTETNGEVATTPDVPEGTLYYKTYFINGDTVEAEPEPPAVDGTIYKTKIENSRWKSFQSGTNVVIPFQAAGQMNYSVVNPGLVSVAGFSNSLLTSPLYEGQDVLFENQTGNSITLKNMFGSVSTKFNFGADLVVPNGGKLWLKVRNNEFELIMKSWADAIDFPSDGKIYGVKDGLAIDLGINVLKDYPNQILIQAVGNAFNYVGTYAQAITGTQSDILIGGGGVSYRKILSATTAGSNANFYDAGIYRVTGTKGFYYRARIKNEDPTNIPTARFSYGFSGTAIMGNINPSTYVQTLLSFGADNTDVNCQIIYKNSTGGATKIDLGATMPKSQSDEYVIEFWRLEGTTTINYKVHNLTTSAIVSGSFVFAFTGLALGCFRNNDIATTAVSFAVRRVELYIND